MNSRLINILVCTLTVWAMQVYAQTYRAVQAPRSSSHYLTTQKQPFLKVAKPEHTSGWLNYELDGLKVDKNISSNQHVLLVLSRRYQTDVLLKKYPNGNYYRHIKYPYSDTKTYSFLEVNDEIEGLDTVLSVAVPAEDGFYTLDSIPTHAFMEWGYKTPERFLTDSVAMFLLNPYGYRDFMPAVVYINDLNIPDVSEITTTVLKDVSPLTSETKVIEIKDVGSKDELKYELDDVLALNLGLSKPYKAPFHHMFNDFFKQVRDRMAIQQDLDSLNLKLVGTVYSDKDQKFILTTSLNDPACLRQANTICVYPDLLKYDKNTKKFKSINELSYVQVKAKTIPEEVLELTADEELSVQNVEFDIKLDDLKQSDSIKIGIAMVRAQIALGNGVKMGFSFKSRKLNYGQPNPAIAHLIKTRNLFYGTDQRFLPKNALFIEKVAYKKSELAHDYNLYLGSKYVKDTLFNIMRASRELKSLVLPSMQPINFKEYLLEKDFVDTLNIDDADAIVEKKGTQSFGWGKAFIINTTRPDGKDWLLPNIKIKQELTVRLKNAPVNEVEENVSDPIVNGSRLRNLYKAGDVNTTVGFRWIREDFNSLATGHSDTLYLIPPNYSDIIVDEEEKTKPGLNAMELFRKNSEFVYMLDLGLSFDDTYYAQNIFKNFYPTNPVTGMFKQIEQKMKEVSNAKDKEIQVAFRFKTIKDRYHKKDIQIPFKLDVSNYKPKVAFNKSIKEYFKGITLTSADQVLTTEKEVIEKLGLALFKDLSKDGIKGYDSIYLLRPLKKQRKRVIPNPVGKNNHYVYTDTLGKTAVDYVSLKYINDSLFFPDRINDGALFYSGFFEAGSNYTVLPTNIDMQAINNEGTYKLKTQWNDHSDADTLTQSPYFAYNFFKTLSDSTTFQLAVPKNDLVSISSTPQEWFKMEYNHDSDLDNNTTEGYAIFFNDTISRMSTERAVLMVDEARIKSGLFVHKQGREYAYVNLEVKPDVKKSESRSIPALVYKVEFDNANPNAWVIDTIPEQLIYQSGVVNKNLKNPSIIKEFDSLSVAFFVPASTKTNYPRKLSALSPTPVANMVYSHGSLFASQFKIATLPKVPFADLKKIDYKTRHFVDTIHYATFEEYLKPLTGVKTPQYNFLERYRINPDTMFAIDTSIYFLISNIDNLDVAMEVNPNNWLRDTIYKRSMSKAKESTYPMLVKITNKDKDTTIYSIEYDKADFPNLKDHTKIDTVSLVQALDARDLSVWEKYYTQIFYIEQWTKSKTKDVRLKMAYQFADTTSFRMYSAADQTKLSVPIYPYHVDIDNTFFRDLKTKFKRPVILDSFWIPNPYRYDNEEFMQLSVRDQASKNPSTEIERKVKIKQPDKSEKDMTYKEESLFNLKINKTLYDFNLDKLTENFKILVHNSIDSLSPERANKHFKVSRNDTLLGEDYPLDYLRSQVVDATITTEFGTQLAGARLYSMEKTAIDQYQIPYLTASDVKSKENTTIAFHTEFLQLLPNFSEPDTIAFQLMLDSTYNSDLFYNQSSVLKLKTTLDTKPFGDSVVVSPAFYQHVINATTVKFDIRPNPVSDPEKLFSFDVPQNPTSEDFLKWIPFKLNKDADYAAVKLSAAERKLLVMVSDKPYKEWPLISAQMEKAYDNTDVLYYARAYFKNAKGQYEKNKFDTVLMVNIPFDNKSTWLMDSLPIQALKHVKMFNIDTFHLSVYNASQDVLVQPSLSNTKTAYEKPFKIYHPNHLRNIQSKPGHWKVPFLKAAKVLDSLRIEPFNSVGLTKVNGDTIGVHKIHFGKLKYSKVKANKDIILNVAISDRELAKPSYIDTVSKIRDAKAWISHYDFSAKDRPYLDAETDFIRRKIRLQGSNALDGDTGHVFLLTHQMNDLLMRMGTQAKDSAKAVLPLHLYMQSIENVTFFDAKETNASGYSIGDFGGFFATLRDERYKKVKTKDYIHSIQPVNKTRGQYARNRLDSTYRISVGVPTKSEVYMVANPSKLFYINQGGVINSTGNTSTLRYLDINTAKSDTIELYLTESDLDPGNMTGSFMQTAALPKAVLDAHFSSSNSDYAKFKASADGVVTEFSRINDKMVIRFTMPYETFKTQLESKTRGDLATMLRDDSYISMIDDNSEMTVFDTITRDIVFTLSQRPKQYYDMVTERTLDGQYILPVITQVAPPVAGPYTQINSRDFIDQYILAEDDFEHGITSAYIYRAFKKSSSDDRLNLASHFDPTNLSNGYASVGDTTTAILFPSSTKATSKVYSDVVYEDAKVDVLKANDSAYVIMTKFDIKNHSKASQILYDSIKPFNHTVYAGVNWKMGYFKALPKDTILYKKIALYNKNSTDLSTEPLITARDYDVIAQTSLMSVKDRSVYIYLSHAQEYRHYYPSVNTLRLYKDGDNTTMATGKEFGGRQFLFNYYINNPIKFDIKEHIDKNKKVFNLDLTKLVGDISADGLKFKLFNSNMNANSLVKYVPYDDAKNQDSVEIILSSESIEVPFFNERYVGISLRGPSDEKHVDTMTVENLKTKALTKVIAVKVKYPDAKAKSEYLLNEKSSFLTEEIRLLHGTKGKLYIYIYDKNQRLHPVVGSSELPLVYPIQRMFSGKKDLKP